MGVYSQLLERIALPDDTEVMATRKKVLVMFFFVPMLLGLAGLFIVSFTSAVIGSWVCLLTNLGALLYMFTVRKPTDTFIEVVGYLDLVAIIFVDLNAMGSLLPRLWPMAVLVVDVFLVCRIRPRSSVVIIVVLSTWLLMTTVEQVTRFGLMDIGGDSFNGGQEHRWNETCGCDTIPCKKRVSSVGITFVLMVTIFLLDYYFTRGFADEVLSEKRKLELGVAAAKDVASFLASFNLEEAERALQNSHEDLPEKLNDALRTILTNLKSYKPYLPQSCLQQESSSSDDGTTTRSATTPVAPSVLSDTTVNSSVTRHSQSRKLNSQIMLSTIRATLLVLNMKGSMAFAEADALEFTRVHSKLTGAVLHALRVHKGVLDMLMGDHVHASFNTSRKCVQHALAGVRSAVSLKQMQLEREINIALAGGKVLAGDLGNHDVRRFSLVGHVAVLGSVFERLGAEWGVGVLCNTSVYTDANVMHEMRVVLKAVTLKKANNVKDALLWEVTVEMLQSHNVVTPRTGERPLSPFPATNTQYHHEWMYELDDIKQKRWTNYNEAAKLYLQGVCANGGGGSDEALRLLATYADEPLASDLADRIMKQEPPPAITVSY